MTDEVPTTQKKKAGRPPKPPMTETAEFKNAVDAAAAKAAAQILASLQASQGGQPKQGDANFAEGLALAIAQLSSQGTGRAKPVAPEVLKGRTDAREKMTEIIIAARARGDIPTYELRNKVYLSEVLIDPIYIDPATKEQRPTSIDWQGVPSEAMIPTNDVAKAIYEAFSNSIGVVHIDQTKFIKPEHFSVTGQGLVVRGGSQALRPMQVGNGQQADPNEADGLRVHGRSSGGKTKTINVLGTVASPARVGA